ncbi:MAG TPA: MFS transporter [Clostridia bacterium]|jgi:GPH family glycoside/pentoside/hexuronide:cation symporter|nr:MAG: Melibiose carrier protein [Firmicutes bacterium ADurb.Bin248]HOS17694.1 MFS transporter [Clostridia bacterium]HPK15958.1 MFS transporter [Clostridia bacterium]
MEMRNISPRLQRVSVVTAGFGQNMLLTFVSTFLLLYLTQYAGIGRQGLIAVAAIMSAGKVFDALNDPLMGTLVDRTRTRWGKLRPYILFSALPVAFFSAILFCIPDASELVKLIFFGVCYVLWDVAYTACDVPFWGLIGAAFSDKGERAKVISYVRAFGAIALGVATLGAPWLAKLLSFAPETTGAGWSRAAILVCAVGMGMFLLAFFNTREARDYADEPQVSLKTLFSAFFSNKPLFLVLLGSILGFGRSVIQAGGAVFAVIAYDDEGTFTLIGGAIIAGMALASFLAPLLLKKVKDKPAMIYSTLFASLVYAAMYFVGFENVFVMMGMIFLTGLTLGVFSVVQTTMIADSVDAMERRTGVRSDGIAFSSLTFVSKLMGSLSVLAFGAVIASLGYEKGVEVTAHMKDATYRTITLLPAASCLVSVVPFLFFELPGEGERGK